MVAGTVTSAAVPGAPAWDVVVGHRFIVAIAAPSPDATTSALAAAAADDAVTVEALVGTIPLGGAGAVESFAIVWWPGPGTDEVTAVVRGDAVVDLTSPGGTRRFDARGIRPWHLADFGSVIALRVTGVDAPLDRLGESGDAVGHARAGFRASAVEWSAAPQPPRRPDAAVADADTVLLPRPHDPDTVRTRQDDTADEHAVADTVRTTSSLREPQFDLASPPTSRIRAIAPAATPSPSPDQDLAGLEPRVLGAGLRLEPASIPVPPEPPTADRDAPTGHDGPAEHDRAAEAHVVASVEPPAAASVEPRAAPGAPAFRIGTGEPRPVTGPVLIGRRPHAPRVPDPRGVVPELVTVASPRAVVSGTHLELRVEGTRVVATDLRSTNGTIVRSAAGVRRMRAGESIVVAPGTRLDLGDDTIIEILPAPTAPPE
ncbi:FHA domain-containing protein [Agromyces mariniharenae]|uniref:FHA domain-containing protein n=1 Tax=Agromyces mariniharenae TaxID=2604423 RepID=A0A5S4UZL6_9MICO|nr:FHA domain-containing protein [Agromyces mariniharenae]TYL52394.1 FHA domain-containing protein [Agromyces mariniharenae]